MNWRVRVRNKWFWVAIIPAVLLLVQQVAAMFGFQLDFHDVEAQLLAIVETVFLLLGILGVIVDPTTKGIGDSTRARYYDEPYDDSKEADNGQQS